MDLCDNNTASNVFKMFTLLLRDINPAVVVGNETDEDDRVVVVADFGDAGEAL